MARRSASGRRPWYRCPNSRRCPITTAVTNIAPLKRALALASEAGDITQLRDIAATASALQRGAKARGMGIDAENQAAEVVLRSERSIGAILLTVPRAKTGPAKGVKGTKGSTSKGSPTSFESAIEAAGLGSNPKAVHQFQTLATLPDDAFESLIAAHRDSGERIAKINFYAAAKPKFADPVARNEVLEAWRSEDPIPVVEKWLAANKALLAHADALPYEELNRIGRQLQDALNWYNDQRTRRAN